MPGIEEAPDCLSLLLRCEWERLGPRWFLNVYGSDRHSSATVGKIRATKKWYRIEEPFTGRCLTLEGAKVAVHNALTLASLSEHSRISQQGRSETGGLKTRQAPGRPERPARRQTP